MKCYRIGQKPIAKLRPPNRLLQNTNLTVRSPPARNAAPRTPTESNPKLPRIE